LFQFNFKEEERMGSSEKVINKVIELIEGCAIELKVNPSQVGYNDFQRFASLDTDLALEIKSAGGFRNIRDSHFPPSVTQAKLVTEMVAKQNRKAAVQTAIENDYVTKLQSALSHVFSKPILPATKLPKKDSFTKRARHLLLSDLHFGADLNPALGTYKYGIEEEARSLAQVILQTIEFKSDYNSITKLFVNINGDIIQGHLHGPTSADALSRQKARAAWLLTQAVALLSKHFPSIEVNCATGNHDRNMARSPNRQINDKWDSNATDVYYTMKLALAPLANVKVNIPLTPWVTYCSFNDWYYGTHGDSHIKIGNPGAQINVTSLEHQINKLNSTLKDGQEYKLVFLGHVHVGLTMKLGNGVTLVTNPPLIPSDEYSQSVGYFESYTAQLVWESVEKHPFGDSRWLEVNEGTRKDKALDKVIVPFQGF
jgi:hypothetical protein